MNILKRFARFFIVLLFSIPLWAMDSNQNLLTDPRLSDLQPLILQYVDPNNLESMAELWKDLNDETFWSPYVRGYLGDLADALKHEGETWREAILRFHTSINHVLSIECWTAKDVEEAISEENYPRLENLLLINLEYRTIINLKELINNPNDFLAALIGYYFYFFAISNSSYYPPVQAACSALSYAASSQVWYKAKAAADSYLIAARDDVSNAIANKVLKNSNINGINLKGHNLFALAYISQADFAENHFINFFNVVQANIDTNQNFDMNADAILDIWFKRAELPESLYKAAFQRIAPKLKTFVKY